MHIKVPHFQRFNQPMKFEIASVPYRYSERKWRRKEHHNLSIREQN